MQIRIENALRKVDDFGRILTPKEAWRQVNYSFHGWGASKNKREKIIKKYVEDLKSKVRRCIGRHAGCREGWVRGWGVANAFS